MSDLLSIGVDVGGTRLKAGLVDQGGAVLATARRDTPGRSAPPAVLEEALLDLVGELRSVASATGRRAASVGVAVAGLVDAARGIVVFAPHLPWREEPLRERLAAGLDLPVVVDNDANAAAWAEHRFGAGRGETHLLLLTLGTGIGGAVLTEGRLQRGRHGLAGELGHVQVVPDGRPCPCGNRGCWEQYVSGTVLRRDGQELVRRGGADAAALSEACDGDPGRLSGDDLTRLAREGDPASRAVLGAAGRWLGTGLAGAVATLDPGTVVVGGGLSEAGDLLLDPARATLAQHLLGRGHRPVPPVVPAALGVGAGLVGAADLARSP
ncbi:ROK family protein [Ornithinimicrobium sufpigmenti]|uniref:ROK family protein n=1 Tax=Ornithinimicrobium sufpigmenti TaxID=2508882 RepID=UPI0010359606|nr:MULTISPECIES: ROK family protein [unclassified Ornithinimicrobium]